VPGALTRVAIADCFVRIEGSPPEEEWGGRGGVISRICDTMCLDKRSNWIRVRRVLQDVKAAAEAGKDYDPHARARNRGRKPILEYGSVQDNVVINAVSTGMSIENTTLVLNTYRDRQGLPAVSQSTVKRFLSNHSCVEYKRRRS